jgi:hypothetical protein
MWQVIICFEEFDTLDAIMVSSILITCIFAININIKVNLILCALYI